MSESSIVNPDAIKQSKILFFKSLIELFLEI